MALQKREPTLPVGREIAVALEQLELDLGGRAAIIAALALAPLTRDTRAFLGLLADPANAARGLVALCQQADMLPGKLIELIDGGLRASGNIRARYQIAKQAAVVVKDVMEKGAPYEGPCTHCQGGKITADPTEAVPNPEPASCPACGGMGLLLYPADPEARKLALDLTGLMPKAGGISITNQQQMGVVVQNGDLDQFQAALDQVLFGGGPVIDTTATEDPQP
jgi:hypothetical protein